MPPIKPELTNEKRTFSRIVPDTIVLKALTHPVRLSILGILCINGSTTASLLAKRLGQNS